jgi:hypothetical protein
VESIFVFGFSFITFQGRGCINGAVGNNGSQLSLYALHCIKHYLIYAGQNFRDSIFLTVPGKLKWTLESHHVDERNAIFDCFKSPHRFSARLVVIMSVA